MSDSTDILEKVETRLSAGEQTNGYLGTLNEQGRERIQKFLQWVSDKNKCELSSIKSRLRKHQLFGTCPDDKKTNFKAANLYTELFYDIEKESNNDVSCPLKFDITANSLLTTLEAEIQTQTGKNKSEKFRYGVVKLGDVPVLYLLYIDPTKDFYFID